MRLIGIALCLLTSFAFGGCPCNKKNVEVIQQEMFSNAAGGYHLILDCRDCDTTTIYDADRLSSFAKAVFSGVGMDSPEDPVLEREGIKGYSFFQHSEKTSLSAHFVESNGNCYIDIFSCTYFNPDIIVKVIQTHLSPTNIKMRFLVRQAS